MLFKRLEAEDMLKEKENELKIELENRIKQLNEEHIQEATKMLRDFEQAQTFLKKQIAAQTKQ